MAKVRKKHNPVARLHKLYRATLPKVWIAGAHCLERPAHGGVRTNSQEHMRYILYERHKWQVMVLAFNYDPDAPPDRQKWADHVVIPHNELSKHGGPVTADELRMEAERRLEANSSTCNPRYLVSPGYWAVPSDIADLEAMKQDIVDWFDKQGAFDLEHCKLVYYLREL